MKHLEIKTVEHKGIAVVVKIDYKAKTISLVESEGYGAKKWVFATREIEYMQGWQNVLDAMKYAVKEATKDLQAHLDAEAEKKEKMMVMIAKEEAKRK